MYTVHYEWGGYWQEKTSFTNRESLIKWLTNGFQPEDCIITIEHKGKKHIWDKNAAYAHPVNSMGRTPEFEKCLRAQNGR